MANKLTFGEYAKKCRAIAKGAPRFADSMLQDLARTTLYTLVEVTPVLTGRARSNWQIGINDIPRTYRHPQPKKPKSPEAGFQEAITRGYKVIDGYTGEGIIYITNNAPYVLYLNTIRPSPQAPPGFIEYAIINAREALRSHKAGFSSFLAMPERLGEGKVIETKVRPRNIGIVPIAYRPTAAAAGRKRGRR